jgi:hypothetical protein
VHAAAPPDGDIAVFNRSHYEDVLVVRVKGFVPKAQWKRRYRHINEFERMLVDEGTTIVKRSYLDVSKAKQAERFTDRLTDETKKWKFRAGDLDDRKLWSSYTKAYEEMLEQTSTEYAPWYVVRPTTTGCATSSSPASCCTPSSGWTPLPQARGRSRRHRRHVSERSENHQHGSFRSAVHPVRTSPWSHGSACTDDCPPPTSLDAALEAIGAHPGALLLAGGTDDGGDQRWAPQAPATVVALGRVAELRSWSHDPLTSTVRIARRSPTPS